jgi:gluconolactonase
MPRHRPPVPVVTNHFGWDFNSVQGVALAPTTTRHAAAGEGGEDDGVVAIYFTDPCHGADSGFRPSPPQLPNQVYRFVPSTGELRVVADGMGRPHGIAASPDGGTVYVSDADAFRADGECDLSRYGWFRFSVFLFRLAFVLYV